MNVQQSVVADHIGETIILLDPSYDAVFYMRGFPISTVYITP